MLLHLDSEPTGQIWTTSIYLESMGPTKGDRNSPMEEYEIAVQWKAKISHQIA